MSLVLRNLDLSMSEHMQVLALIYSIRTNRRIDGYLAPDMPDFCILQAALEHYNEYLKIEATTLKGQTRLEF